MRVLICGSRDWTNKSVITFFLDKLLESFESITIIEGCCRGADRVACEYGLDNPKVIHEHFPADWKKYGRAAGPIRNQQMIDEGNPDVVVAFTDDLIASKGTRDMVERSTKADIRVYLTSGRHDPCIERNS